MRDGEPRYRLAIVDQAGHGNFLVEDDLEKFVYVIGQERYPSHFEMNIKSRKGVIFSEDMIEGHEKIKNAFELARTYHFGRTRKVGDAPVVGHILDTTRMLWEAGFDKDVIAAGLGHDLLEDTKCTELEITLSCGDEVLRIIKAVSNDPEIRKAFGWRAVKEHYIQTVEAGGEKAIAVCIADKISNLTELLEQFDAFGSSIWEEFNAPMEDKLWFEQAVRDMAKKHWDHPLLQTYEMLVARFERLAASHASHVIQGRIIS